MKGGDQPLNFIPLHLDLVMTLVGRLGSDGFLSKGYSIVVSILLIQIYIPIVKFSRN